MDAPRRARGPGRIARSLGFLLVAAAFVTVTADAPGPDDGLAAFKAGRYEEALVAFRAGTRERPGAAEPAANVGAALCRLGRAREAVPVLEAALRLDPSARVEAAIRYDLGTARLELGDLDAAIEDLTVSLRLAPGDVQAKMNLEIALRRRGERPPPPPGQGGVDTTARAPGPSPPSGGAPSQVPGAPLRLTREEAERLLDALGRRERLEMPRPGRHPASEPTAPDW